MKSKRLKLPIGIQTFETIRTVGFVYVDKTNDYPNIEMLNSMSALLTQNILPENTFYN